MSVTQSHPAEPAAPAPVAPSGRIDAVDIARGFALFGVLMVNMLIFAGSAGHFPPVAVPMPWWDRTAEMFIRLMGEGAFYSIFSLLFGLGFAMQFDRAAQREQRFAATFAVRLALLAVFGVLHGIFVWDGDILLQYAIAGFGLMLFRKATARTMIRWSGGLALFSLLAVVALSVAMYLSGESVSAEPYTDLGLLTTGTFWDLANERLSNAGETLIQVAFTTTWFLSLFLAGGWIVRSGRLVTWREDPAFLRSVLRVSVPVAVVGKGAMVALILGGDSRLSGAVVPVLSVIVGGPALGATYLALLALALRRNDRWLRHLAPVGRMALTNYLMQSVTFMFVFAGWGLGWFDRWGVAAALGITVGFFGAQMVFSRLWLDRFRFGPMEWLWRAGSYRTFPPMRRSGA